MKILAIVTSAVIYCTAALLPATPAFANSSHLPKEPRTAGQRLPTRIIREVWSRIAVQATAYVVDTHAHGCFLNTARTASGTVADIGTIAVDTNVFPFGTRFFIPGYGYGRATDTGGLIRGRHIDLAMRSCSRALAWGSRIVRVSYTRP